MKAGLFSKKNKQVVGVDIGSRFTKKVILHHGEPPTLKHYSLESIDQELPDYSQTVSKKVITGFFRHGMAPPSDFVGISISGQQVFLTVLSLPGLSEKNLREHLALELDRYIPFDVRDVVWDISCHKNPFLDGRQEYYLIVAKKEFIETRIKHYVKKGMKIQFIDVDIFALVNMMPYNYGNQGTWLIVHPGPSGILSVVVEEGMLIDIRQTSYKGEWYGHLFDQLFLPNETFDATNNFGVSESLLRKQFVNELTEQTIDILKAFAQISEARGPNILLSGGYSGVEDLPAKLTESLKAPVTMLNPFKKISVPLVIQEDRQFQKNLPLLGVAVGVALRGVINA